MRTEGYVCRWIYFLDHRLMKFSSLLTYKSFLLVLMYHLEWLRSLVVLHTVTELCLSRTFCCTSFHSRLLSVSLGSSRGHVSNSSQEHSPSTSTILYPDWLMRLMSNEFYSLMKKKITQVQIWYSLEDNNLRVLILYSIEGENLPNSPESRTVVMKEYSVCRVWWS